MARPLLGADRLSLCWDTLCAGRLVSLCEASNELGLEAFAAQLDPDRLWPQVKDGSISISEPAAVRMAYEKFFSSPDAYILMLGLMCGGEKP